MQTITLPNTDLTVSRVAMGCWAIAGDATWGPQNDADAIAGVHAALDAGITLLDTAELYGAGVSERLLGRALVGRRDEAVIATKFNPDNSAPELLVAACERSLTNLGTDRIDLYQIHWRSRNVPLEDTWATLEKLQQQGKIRAVGVSNFGPRDLADLLAIGRPATNQLPYNLLTRAIEYEIIPACRAEQIGILCYSPLLLGLLAGKYATADDVPDGRARMRHFSAGRPQTRHGEQGCEGEAFEALATIRQVAQMLDRTMADVALAWLLQRPGVHCVLAGVRNPRQAHANAAAAELTLPAEVVDVLDSATEPVKLALGTNPDMWQGQGDSRYR